MANSIKTKIILVKDIRQDIRIRFHSEIKINNTSFADTVQSGKTMGFSREAFRGGLTV